MDDGDVAGLAAVATRDVAQGQHRVGQAGRRLEFEGELPRGQHGGELFHAFQRLDPALRLLGLGRLGLEAVDEARELGDLFLLALEGRLLLALPLGAHELERAVVAAVARERLLVEVQRDAGGGVEKLAVVADHQQRAFEALEPAFEPDEGVQVQVVGGLVEQQQVGRTHQRAGQLQAHAPATRKAVDGRVELLNLEAQPHQQGLRTRAGIEGVGLGQRGVSVGDGMAVAALLGACQGGLSLGEAGVALDHEVGGGLRRFGHRLRHLGHAPVGGHLGVAAIGMQFAGEQGEQRRLARAVVPHQGDLLAGLQGEGDVIEDHLGAAAQGEVFQLDHERRTKESGSAARGGCRAGIVGELSRFRWRRRLARLRCAVSVRRWPRAC